MAPRLSRMLLSATWFARQVATEMAPPRLTRTRSAAATENFSARPGPPGAAATGASAGAVGGAGGWASTGTTRVESPELGCGTSVPVRIVVRRRIFLPVLVRMGRVAKVRAVERDRERDGLPRGHVDRSLVVAAPLVPRADVDAPRGHVGQDRAPVRARLRPVRSVDHEEIGRHLGMDV